MPVDVGDEAPEAIVEDYDSAEKVSLSWTWAERPAVLVFQRYFGCPFCQDQITGLIRDRRRFMDAGARVALIGHGERRAVELGQHLSPFRTLFDPGRDAYRAYGLERGSLLTTAGPAVWMPLLRVHGTPGVHQRGLRGGDLRQLPGTFIVDTAGVIHFVHRNVDAADNPSNAAILSVLSELTG